MINTQMLATVRPRGLTIIGMMVVICTSNRDPKYPWKPFEMTAKESRELIERVAEADRKARKESLYPVENHQADWYV